MPCLQLEQVNFLVVLLYCLSFFISSLSFGSLLAVVFAGVMSALWMPDPDGATPPAFCTKLTLQKALLHYTVLANYTSKVPVYY